MRHCFVSLLSDAKVPIEDIARLWGHRGTAVTERVYWHQIRPVMVEASTAMDGIVAEGSGNRSQACPQMVHSGDHGRDGA